MAGVREGGSGLKFPEGPVAMSDGSVVLVEIQGGRISRVSADGSTDVVAETGGGPNGSAIGPDGKLYVANNGGAFEWHEIEGLTIPGATPDTWEGGRIERVDLDSDEVDVLYREYDGNQLRWPDDLVFDTEGCFWFTDHGTHGERQVDVGGVYYAKADGSEIREVILGSAVAERGRPVARRVAALCRRDVDRPAVDLGGPEPGAGDARARARRARRDARRRPARAPAVRLARRRRRGQRVRGDDHHDGRRHHVDLAGRLEHRADRVRRPADDEHLLGRRGPADGVHHVLGDRAARVGRVAAPGTGAGVQRVAAADGTHKLPVKAAIRKAIGKSAGDPVVVRLEERIG